jgi:cellulose synthase operon protein C
VRMGLEMNKNIISGLVYGLLLSTLVGCSTPEEKAQKYFEKGMELLESDPAKAKLEFQNALQMKKNMTPAIYGMALAAEKQADWQATFVLLNKVLEEDPQHIEATVKVGQLFLAAGELNKAKEMVDKAFAINKDNLNAIVLQASIDLKQNKFADAVSKAQQVLKRDPKSTDAIMVLASERYASKDVPGAINYIDQGLKLNEKNLVMHLFKIQALETTGNIEQTENAYTRVIEVFPENYMIRTKLAEFYYNNNKKAEAETQLRYLVEKQPDQLEPKINLAKYLSATKGESAGLQELEKMAAESPDNYELSFYLIGLYEKQKNTEAADKLLNAIVKNAGDKPEGLKAKVKVASKLLQAKQKQKAVALLDEVLEADGGQQDALMLKAGIAMDERRFDDAIIELRTVLRDQPNYSQALLMMAKTYEYTGSAALAEESYSKALESSRNAPEYGVTYAKYLLTKNEADRAEKVLDDVMKGHPNNVETIKLLAQVKIFKGDIDGAKLLANKVKSFNNGNLAQLIEGSILAKSNDYSGSLNAFMKAHELAPNDMQPIYAIVRTYMGKKNYKEALAFLDTEIGKSPTVYELKILQAQVAIAGGNLLKAKSTYQNAIASDPNRMTAYQQLAYLNLSQGDVASAKSNIQKGLEIVPNSFDLKMVSAEIHQYEKEYSKAIAVYEELMTTNPDSQVALNNYVSIVADIEKDKAKLEKAYQAAQKLKSTNVPQFMDTLGWISYKVGKYDEAEAALQKAIKAMPQYSIFHLHLGKVYLEKNDKTKAKQSLEKALELDKSTSQTAEIKELLKAV